MAKFSKTGVESGASEASAITPIKGKFLMPFGQTPNDILTRHRAAQEGVELWNSTRDMEAGNRFEDPTAEWFADDFKVKLSIPEDAFRLPDCRLAASLDRLIHVEDRFVIEDFDGVSHILEGTGNLEIKIPRRKSPIPNRVERWIQVQAQMECADLRWSIIAELPRMDLQWNIGVVKRDEKFCQMIRDAVNVFWEHMENDTDYPPITSSEANSMIPGNPREEPLDLSEGHYEGCPLTKKECEDLADLSKTFISSQNAKKAAINLEEETKLGIQEIMGTYEKIYLPDRTLSWGTREYKSKPAMASVPLNEKLSVKDAAVIRKFAKSISEPQTSKLGRAFRMTIHD